MAITLIVKIGNDQTNRIDIHMIYCINVHEDGVAFVYRAVRLLRTGIDWAKPNDDCQIWYISLEHTTW